MILKNEEPNVHRLLGKIGHLFDEICVCDTGSTDGTVEACLQYGARVVKRPWRGFADARNHAMSLSFSRYCMWLDGDDDISPDDVQTVRVALDSAAPNMGFFVGLYCESPFPERRMSCDQLRIYPNLPGVVWDRKIHEQVINSCAKIGCRFAKIPVTVRHLGYDLSEEANHAKYERNMALLQEEIVERPGDIMTLFHIAQTMIGLGREKDALPLLNALACEPATTPFIGSIASRSALIAANIFTQAADKVATTMLEGALAISPDEDMVRVSLAERYWKSGKYDRVQPTLQPIRDREAMRYSLLPYPMDLVGQIAVKLWMETA